MEADMQTSLGVPMERLTVLAEFLPLCSAQMHEHLTNQQFNAFCLWVAEIWILFSSPLKIILWPFLTLPIIREAKMKLFALSSDISSDSKKLKSHSYLAHRIW